MQKTSNIWSNLEKEEQSWTTYITRCQHSGREADSVVLAQRPTEQWDRTGRAVVTGHLVGPLTFNKDAKGTGEENTILIKKWFSKKKEINMIKLDIHREKSEP